jgi:hypothetical protein
MRDHQRLHRRKNPDLVKATEGKRDKSKRAAARRVERAIDPEPSRAALSKSFQKHKVKRMAEMRAWKKAHPEEFRALQKAGKANRRALEKAATGRISKADVLHLFEVQLGMCAAQDCRVDLANGFQLDHVIPLSRGGFQQCEQCAITLRAL